jgi:hypothetical protein
MSAPPNARTQQASILQLLRDAKGAWVPLPRIMECAAQCNARTFDLRRQGFKIENRTETINEIKYSWFRLVLTASQEFSERAPTESDYMRHVREERAKAEPLFAGTACQ